MSEKLSFEVEEHKLRNLEDIASYVRAGALECIMTADNGHIGGNLSSVELLTGLYFGGQFNFDPDNPKNPNRDRVLIRGHEGPLRYTIFSLMGYIEPEELKTYRSLGSRLQGHEDMFETPGVDITPSGSLGMLLSYGVGSAVANKHEGVTGRTIVFLGDGEEQEGNISEAARHATTLNLNNLICIIDKNTKQLSRSTSYSDGGSDLEKIWEGYGWNVLKIEDGHNLREIVDVYETLRSIESPTVVIANTIKGCGVQGASEHFSGYHTLSAASDKELVIESLRSLNAELRKANLTHDSVSSLALSLTKRPLEITEIQKPHIDPQTFDIRTAKSGVSLEQAQHDYMTKLKNRILDNSSTGDFYFITPDLLRSDIAEEAEFEKFAHFIDTGIREQHAIAMSHGISVENPEARIYVCYGDAFAYRALDQINAAATSQSNIMIVGENAGLFQGQNGKTHQSVGQPAALMSIPELSFYEPADAVDLQNIFSNQLVDNTGVSYVRFHRGTVNIQRNTEDVHNVDAYFIHKSDSNPEAVLMASGFMAENAVSAAKNLEIQHGIPTNVINVVNQKSLATYAERLVENNAPIITLYNGNPKTLMSSVASMVMGAVDIPRPDFIIGHGYEAGTSGKVDDLVRHFGLDTEGIVNFVLKSLKDRR